MKYEPLFKCVHGSHLYGLNTKDSDMDYKGVFMPEVDELLLGASPTQLSLSSGDGKTKNTANDTDEDWYSLPQFIKLAIQGETIALDMLHADYGENGMLQSSEEWQFIRENRDRFYTKNMKAFLGYARKQASKYGIKGSRMGALEEVYNLVKQASPIHLSEQRLKNSFYSLWEHLPTNEHCYFITNITKNGDVQNFYEVLGSKYQDNMPALQFVESITRKWSEYGERARAAKNNEGVDWKALSHAIRAAIQLKEIYLEGKITYPLRDKELLLDVKLGKLDFTTQVAPLLDELILEVEELAESSDYPDKVDTKFWDNWLLKVYRESV